MTSITRRYRFAGSHRLHSSRLSDEQNAQLYGKCNNPFGHGHDYILEVGISGPVDQQTGLMLRGSQLDTLVRQAVTAEFANCNFNVDVPEFQQLIPTTENIATVIASRLQKHWSDYIQTPGLELTRVHVQETDRNGFELTLPSQTSAHGKNT